MPNMGPNFYPKLVQISSEVGMKPEDLIAVMISESGMNPSAVEQKYKGSGLIGFMPNTLKGLGFKGTWEDFIKLSGEEQLDYVKKVVQGNMKLNGGPFTSAGQYYTANLWPAALKLPGVRQGDPKTPILEENPERGGPDNKYSKKYFDLGFKISADFESKAYKANPLFDKDKKGAITYGDMMNQVEKNKQNPIYQKAIAAMREQTGYQANKTDSSMLTNKNVDEKSDFFRKYLSRIKGKEMDVYDQIGGNKSQTSPTSPTQMNSVLDSYLKMIAASEKSNKKLYRKFLPYNTAVIRVTAMDYVNAVEFARVLCSVLDEELFARAFTHTDGKNVDVECSIPGPKEECFAAAKQLTDATAGAFKKATIKLGGIDIKTKLVANKRSHRDQIDLKEASLQYRKFLLKFI